MKSPASKIGLFCLLFFLLPLLELSPDYGNFYHGYRLNLSRITDTTLSAQELASQEKQPLSLAAPELKSKDYPRIKGVNGRRVVWIAGQLHLFLAAFVLAIPIFVLITEFIGIWTGDQRYDAMAREFMKISMAAYSLTALVGGFLTMALFTFYPHMIQYLMSVFGEMNLWYGVLFMLESITLYTYFYSWGALRHGFKKWAHLSLCLLLNVVGLTLMFVANAWVSFITAPSGIDEAGVRIGSIWGVIQGHLWNPLNLHRFIANIAYGGAIVGGYAAFKFISSQNSTDKAHYDWMGYVANLIALTSFIPLPFAGYWLMAEIYAYSQQMGITAMGGILAWFFIVQAILIGSILLAYNYYLWCGMSRIEGAERYTPYIKYIAFVIVGAFLVWFTPHTLILTPAEIIAMGGTNHKLLGPLGIMPAKNTAVNLMLLFTYLSFQLYRRSAKKAVVNWETTGNLVTVIVYLVGVLNIVLAGIYGYLTPTVYKVGASVPQVATTLSVIFFTLILDKFMYKKAELNTVHWGKMSIRSQYALFVLPIAFTWLMALMGFVRSTIKGHWHIYTVLKDRSAEAFIPSLGEAGNVITIVTLLFLGLVCFVFWLSSLGTITQKQS